jgi:ubiquinone/menaquinone biosynthesis C-methylase UbiE
MTCGRSAIGIKGGAAMKMSKLEKLFVNSRRRQRGRVVQAKRLLSGMPLENARDYLEVGCGTGAVTRFVATELGLQAIGIDIDPEQIALAGSGASGLANARFQEGDATRLPFEDGSFDVVLSFMATHHIEDVDTALREIARVLRPGGYFVYSDVFLPAIIAGIGALFGHSYKLPRSDRLIEALSSAGFATVSASHTGGKFYGRYESLLQRQPVSQGRPETASTPPARRLTSG